MTAEEHADYVNKRAAALFARYGVNSPQIPPKCTMNLPEFPCVKLTIRRPCDRFFSMKFATGIGLRSAEERAKYNRGAYPPRRKVLSLS
jgi:hypothetical protein